MLRVTIPSVVLGLLLPVLTLACEGTRKECKEQFGELVAYRAEAIARAFGDLPSITPDKIAIRFVGSHDTAYRRYGRRVAYDADQAALIVPKQFIAARMPKPLRATAYYWPFYENTLYRETFPLIIAIDNALWGAFLQEAAAATGMSWPHANCGAVQMVERLPCEMLVAGVSAHLTTIDAPLFNTNRVDRIWPQDFAAFSRRVWRRDDPRYLDVQRYGGLMLVKPLIDRFGAPQALLYIAQTPFAIEDNNLAASAEDYQARASERLSADRNARHARSPLLAAEEAR